MTRNKGQTATILQEESFAAPPDVVYRALVEADEVAAFTGAEASGEAKEGAEFTAWDGYITGVHLNLVPGRRIVQSWSTTEWPKNAPPSRLEIELTAEGDGTRLKMKHSDVPAEQAEGYRKGWIEYYWSPLRDYLED